jgi:hypothetical protein
MPYDIKYVKGADRPYRIIKKDTGKEVGSSTSMKDAMASIRARYSGENKVSRETIQ